MYNNDILRRLRYTFDYNDSKMIGVFRAAEFQATRKQLSAWLKRDEDPEYEIMSHKHMAIFLNGLINQLRGKKDGPQPAPETHLTNNLVLRKLKIALNLKDTDMMEIMDRAGYTLSRHELSAFFRAEGHRSYRACQDQVLRNFLKGLQLKYRAKGTDAGKQEKPVKKKVTATPQQKDLPKVNRDIWKR